MFSRHFQFRLSTLLRIALTVVVIAAIFSACSDSTDSPSTSATPSSTLGPTPVPSPTPVPADLGLARRHERNGEYDEAIAVYQAVVDGGSRWQQQEARNGLVRLLLWYERFQEANHQAAAYLEEAEGTGEQQRGEFLVGRTQAALGEHDLAIGSFSRYLELSGIVTPYARLEMARSLLALDRLTEAAEQIDLALRELPSSQRPAALLSMAQGLESAGDVTGALEWYERLFEESESPSDRALVLERQGMLRQSLGDPSWAGPLHQVVSSYPATSTALTALEELQAAGESIDPYLQGLVYYRHFYNDEAMSALDRSLAEQPDGPNAAAAHYYRAALLERFGEDDEAIAEYAASYDLDSSGGLADDGLWWRGRLLEKQGRDDEAREAYDTLALSLPSSEWAADGAFRVGFVLYGQERFRDAANAWMSIAATSSDSERIAEAALWSAKAELAAGDETIAFAHLQELAQHEPFDFYGLRAAALLLENDVEVKPMPTPIATPIGSGLPAWLSTGEPLPEARRDLLTDEHWPHALELVALGLPRQANAELHAFMTENAADPSALWSLAHVANWFGLAEVSSRSAQRALDSLSSKELALVPPEAWQLAFPRPYLDVLQTAEDEKGVPVWLMLALIRQESFYDPLAGSSAGAAGLTQVIAPTGEEIAADLGLDDFDPDQLLLPHVSIRFGAHYLSEQLAKFDDVYCALAAYNAGPDAAMRWHEVAADDVDAFVQEIEYDQAKAYVQLVSENLAMYRYAYGLTERPSLQP